MGRSITAWCAEDLMSGSNFVRMKLSWDVPTDKAPRPIARRFCERLPVVCQQGDGPKYGALMDDKSMELSLHQGLTPRQVVVAIGVLAEILYAVGGLNMRVELLDS